MTLENKTLLSEIDILSGFPFASENFTTDIATPLIRIRDLLSGEIQTYYHGVFDRTYLVNQGDILIGMDGDFSVVRWKGEPALLNQRICKISSISKELDSQFLYWWLKPHIEEIHRKTPQTTVRHLSIHDIYRIPAPAISKDQQAVAARVLDTLDAAIEKSETLIAKLKQVRAGMLHDLLTCGVDENGEVRDPVRHPEFFKESSLGKIPADWKLVRIGDEADIEHGFAFSGQFFTNSPVGPRILVPGNFHRDGGLYFTDTNTKYYAAPFPKKTILPNGSILVVMTDLSPMTLILGRTVLLNESFELLHNQRIGKFVLKKPEEWDSQFFVELMNDQRIRQRVILEATGTTVRHTSPERIKNGLALKPNRNEQSLIIKIVQGIDDEIRESVNALVKITGLRSALQSDLLTGQVRIPPDLELP